MDHKRVLGIDYGTQRIGVALSDPLRIIASAYRVLENNENVWSELRTIAEKEQVDLVVVGMPLTLRGEQGEKAKEVRRFVEEFKQHVSLDVVFWDERFTTSLAHQYRLSSGIGRKARRTSKRALDAAAAAIMLQGFLDSTKKSLSC